MLVRRITADALTGKTKSPALSIMNSTFSSNTELGKELSLYRVFFDGTSLNEAKAVHFIELILTQRKKLDEQKLAKEKYALIKEIKKHYDLKDFLSAKIPDYTIHASIYKTFASEVASDGVDILNIRDVVNAKYTLIEHLSGKSTKRAVAKTNALMEEYKTQSEEVRMITYKLLIEKFNDKYANLGDNQKALLREYINNVASTNTLYQYVSAEVPKLKARILELGKHEKNKVIQIKLNEVVSQLSKVGNDRNVKDNEITALMHVYQIISELESGL